MDKLVGFPVPETTLEAINLLAYFIVKYGRSFDETFDRHMVFRKEEFEEFYNDYLSGLWVMEFLDDEKGSRFYRVRFNVDIDSLLDKASDVKRVDVV